MYKVTKKIAQFYFQDRAKEEGRFIWTEADFTESEQVAIKDKARELRKALQAGNGKSWHDYMLENIKVLVPGLFIGFKMQDAIVNACKHNGIKFSDFN